MKKNALRIIALLLVTAMLAGCSSEATETKKKKRKKVKKETTTETTTESTTESTTIDTEPSEPTDTTGRQTVTPPNGVTDFSMFIAMPGTEINSPNDIQEEIANLTGVRVKETYLSGMTADEAISIILASGDFPDFIDGGAANYELYLNGALIAWDDYLADPAYSNLRELYSDKEWELFRQADGHIYWANQFDRSYGEDTTTIHNSLAFWIQVRVLEWDGYPKIETLEEYFDLLERYYEANPVNEDGTKVIPYTCLNEGWRDFTINGVSILLDGFENNRPVIVDDQNYSTPTVVDYTTTETTKAYLQTLNEAYKRGLVDPDFDSMDYDEYVNKICSGAVLGMCDEWWDFYYNIQYDFANNGFSDLGYDYVPLALTIDKGMENRYHSYEHTINNASGVAVTTGCQDPDLAFSFMNSLLDQEILNLRNWGMVDIDYMIDADGIFYKTDNMRAIWKDSSYRYSHVCEYPYFPNYYGTSRDGINAMRAAEQPDEFMATLPEPVARCFEAYGKKNYVDFLGSVKEEPRVWYPMYSFSNTLTYNSDGGAEYYAISDLRHEYSPILIKSTNFKSDWKDFMNEYDECNPDKFIEAMQKEVDRRIADS